MIGPAPGVLTKGPNGSSQFGELRFPQTISNYGRTFPPHCAGATIYQRRDATDAAWYMTTRPLHEIKKFWVETIAELLVDGRFADAGTGIES